MLSMKNQEQLLAYGTGLLSGMFFKVLGSKDIDGFKDACLKSLLIIIAMVTIKSVRIYTTKMLTVGWRKELCSAIHRLYLEGMNFYRLLYLDGREVDNPDQRMTADCSSITKVYGGIIADLVVVPFTIGYYTYQAYSRAGWLGPSAMFTYFLISTFVNKILMGPVVNLTVTLEQTEGDFRYKHMEIRANAESLAFCGSAKHEQEKVNKKLFEVCKVQRQLYTRNFPIDMSVNLFAYLGAVVSYLVIAVPIFSGNYDKLQPSDLAQVISETAFVNMYLVSQLGQLVNITSSVASLAGSTHRVGELMEKLTDYSRSHEDDTITDRNKEDIETGLIDNDEQERNSQYDLSQDNCSLCVENLSFRAPDSSSDLVKDLNLSLHKGVNLLIMGPSGCGKSSFLRVLNGLWKYSGRILTNKSFRICYVPQTPFFTDGCLKEQLFYPDDIERLNNLQNDTDLFELLNVVELSSLLSRCGGLSGSEMTRWYSDLSPGEQQKVAWVRLLVNRPDLAFLDEATSAVSEDLEYTMYKSAMDRGITLISVGHRKSLIPFHHKVLIFDQSGGWTLEDVNNDHCVYVS